MSVRLLKSLLYKTTQFGHQNQRLCSDLFRLLKLKKISYRLRCMLETHQTRMFEPRLKLQPIRVERNKAHPHTK